MDQINIFRDRGCEEMSIWVCIIYIIYIYSLYDMQIFVLNCSTFSQVTFEKIKKYRVFQDTKKKTVLPPPPEN